MEFDIKKIEKMSEIKRLEFIHGIMPYLDSFPQKRGLEGCVYFLNNDLILKKYDTNKNYDVMSCIFDAYCEESISFSNRGYRVPKIFAWTKVPKKVTDSSRLYDFFVLEERVPGKDMFLGKLDDIYEFFSDQYTVSDFNYILGAPDKFTFEYKQIVKKYIQRYVEMNQIIDKLSYSEMKMFIETVRVLHAESKYNVPDVHAKNVILSPSSLYLIDNYVYNKSSLVYMNRIDSFEFLVSRIIILFRQNSNILNLKKSILTEHLSNSEIEELIDSNMDLCASSIKKLLAVAKECCNHSNGVSAGDYQRMVHHLNKILDQSRAHEVLLSFEIDKHFC